MSKKIITKIEDIRDGDIAKMRVNGHEYNGPAHVDAKVRVEWANWVLRGENGLVTEIGHGFISATRRTPPLPTKKGSVILIHEAHEERCVPPVLALHRGTHVLQWKSIIPIKGKDYHLPEHISLWQEVAVTPQGPVIEQ